jgi:glycosyltransferase involved in cell wall biosynthesis
VSVVTPFFNTEKYLPECIESVLKQTYRNWEYILVDNCSTDNSLAVAAHYAEKDERIRVYNNEVFLTQPQNYNRALRLISSGSKCVKMVQADDWIFHECLTEMVRVAEAHPSVGIVGAYRLDDKRVNCDGLPYPSTMLPGRHICRLSLLNQCSVFGTATSILILSEIVKNRKPFFNESSNHEDTEACYEILHDRDFGFVHKVLTFTRRENESISSTIRRYDPFHLLDHFISLKRYGRASLGEDEYRAVFKEAENRYLQFLSQNGIWGGEGFWKYHKESLDRIGYTLNWRRLSKHFCLELIDLAFNPKMAAGKLTRHLLRKSSN